MWDVKLQKNIESHITYRTSHIPYSKSASSSPCGIPLCGPAGGGIPQGRDFEFETICSQIETLLVN
jgi:hypothetical protein